MKKGLLPYNSFLGIVKSVSKAPSNSFQSLINLRTDLRLGGLVNRLGIRNPQTDDGSILTTSIVNLDSFTFQDFSDIKPFISLGDQSIRVHPCYYGGIGTAVDPILNQDRDITQIIRFINTGSAASGLVMMQASPTINGPFFVKGKARINGYRVIADDPTFTTNFNTYVHVGDILLMFDPLGNQIQNRTILSIDSNTQLTTDTFTPNSSVYYTMQSETVTYLLPVALDTLTLGANVYTFQATRTGAFTIAIGATTKTTADNIVFAVTTDDLVVKAQRQGASNANVIITAKTVGSSGNSIALAKSSSAITLSGATLSGGIDSSSQLGMTAISTNTITLSAGVFPTNGIFKYGIIRNMSLATNNYASVVQVNNEYPTPPQLVLNKDVAALGWTTSHLVVFYETVFQAARATVTDNPPSLYNMLTTPQFITIDGINSVALVGVGDNVNNKAFWIGRIKSRNYFGTAFSFNGIYCSTLMDDFSYGAFSPSVHHISISSDNVPAVGPSRVSNRVFQFSFSLKLDGFNETKLIYTGDPYGNLPTNNSPTDTNFAEFIDIVDSPPPTTVRDIGVTRTPPKRTNDAGINNSTITLNIFTNLAELISRRVTSIMLYSRQLSVERGRGTSRVFFRYAWRRVKEIMLNDPAWTYNAGTYTYSTTVTGDQLMGEIYSDRLGYAETDDLTKISYYGTELAQRTFVRNDTDKQTIYFSQINDNGASTSAIASSNFFILSKVPGEVVGLASINNRLLAFKKFSYFTVNIDGLPTVVRDDYVSDAHGLASVRSVATGGRFLYFNSYDGIYRTDGFKDELINRNWIEDYRALTDQQKESAYGFFDTYSDSYLIIIGGLIWGFDSKTGHWRQEDYTHTSGIVTYAFPKIIARRFDGRNIFYGANSGDGQLYEYPRADLSYIDSISGLTDQNMLCSWENNIFEPDEGLDFLSYVNNAYILGEGIETTAGISLSLKRGTVILKTSIITNSRYVFPFTIRTPADRFSVSGSVSTGSKLVIREYGLYTELLKRAGSVRVSAT